MENHRCVVHKTTNFVKYQHDKGANPSEAMKQACFVFFFFFYPLKSNNFFTTSKHP